MPQKNITLAIAEAQAALEFAADPRIREKLQRIIGLLGKPIDARGENLTGAEKKRRRAGATKSK